jgi:hypothetical protein
MHGAEGSVIRVADLRLWFHGLLVGVSSRLVVGSIGGVMLLIGACLAGFAAMLGSKGHDGLSVVLAIVAASFAMSGVLGLILSLQSNPSPDERPERPPSRGASRLIRPLSD